MDSQSMSNQSYRLSEPSATILGWWWLRLAFKICKCYKSGHTGTVGRSDQIRGIILGQSPVDSDHDPMGPPWE